MKKLSPFYLEIYHHPDQMFVIDKNYCGPSHSKKKGICA
jgi:hypothetical protein